MSEIQTQYEEADVEWVTVPVAGQDLQGAALALLDAAGDRADLVRSVSGGFRAPYNIVRAAGLLGEIAQEEPGVPEVPLEEPTAPPVVDEEPAVEPEAPAEEPAPAPKTTSKKTTKATEAEVAEVPAA